MSELMGKERYGWKELFVGDDAKTWGGAHYINISHTFDNFIVMVQQGVTAKARIDESLDELSRINTNVLVLQLTPFAVKWLLSVST